MIDEQKLKWIDALVMEVVGNGSIFFCRIINRFGMN